MTETWQLVPGFPEVKVSNLGRVHYTATGKTVQNKSSKGNGGTVKVGGAFISRAWLVALLFVPCPNYDTYTSVWHKDDDRKNNAASNLEWRKPQTRAQWQQRIVVVPPALSDGL
jgi:hypothetical protein